MEKKDFAKEVAALHQTFYTRIKEALKINEGDLRGEIFKHPSTAFYWHSKGSDAKRVLDSLEFEEVQLSARLKAEFYEQAGKMAALTLQEKSRIYVALHPEMTELRKKLSVIRSLWDLLDGARWRFSERYKTLLNERNKRVEEDSSIYKMQKEMEE